MTSLSKSPRVTRRSAIAGLAAFPIAAELLSAGRDAFGNEGDELVIREREPQNLESDFAALESFVTPNDKFYVRNHFPVPKLDIASWRLKIEGAVKKPFELSYDELTRMPSETRPVTLECAGNGRVLLVPKVDGAQWQFGAVGNAEWTGVPLAAVLERAGVDAKAVDIVLEGADSGEVSKPSKPAKPFHFARSVPVEQARTGGILLAYKMNGQPLPEAHGFPVRAIVPGWFGMASIKWLSRIIATTQPFTGFFQTVDYAYWQHRDGVPVRVPLTEMQVKAQIARPTFAEALAKGANYRIFGAAWSGNSAIKKVEVSTDDGKTYVPAKLLGDSVDHAWRLWEYPWKVPATAGKYVLKVKATDANGNTQPTERDKDRENYMINHVVPIEVFVR
jgi:DMSO/TMAO reductase YedYZ molybdopterin-dependent catalytic subunit